MVAAYSLGSIRRDDLDDSELHTPRYAAVSHHCGGCRAHPSPDCACCGAPTDFILPAGPKHSITYCRRCYRAVQAVRAQSRAEGKQQQQAAAAISVRNRQQRAAERQELHQKRTIDTSTAVPSVSAAPARANVRTGERRSRSPKQHKRGAA